MNDPIKAPTAAMPSAMTAVESPERTISSPRIGSPIARAIRSPHLRRGEAVCRRGEEDDAREDAGVVRRRRRDEETDPQRRREFDPGPDPCAQLCPSSSTRSVRGDDEPDVPVRPSRASHPSACIAVQG